MVIWDITKHNFLSISGDNQLINQLLTTKEYMRIRYFEEELLLNAQEKVQPITIQTSCGIAYRA